MTITAGVVDGSPGRRPGAHSLLISETVEDQRAGAASWVDRQLAGGAKVYYKGRVGDDPAADAWLTGPAGVPGGREALRTGQLEVVDFSEVLRRTGGTTAGFDALRAEEIARGLDEGWPRVAMSQESPGLTLADEREAADYAEQEAGFDAMASRWPLTTLCQLTTVDETSAGIREAAAVHFHGILAEQWSSWVDDGRWCLQGELDVHVVQRFGAALHGAQRRQLRAEDDPDLHVDVSAVDFFDVACARSLMLAAAATGHRQRIVLHGAHRPVRDILAVVGHPPTVRYADDGGAR